MEFAVAGVARRQIIAGLASHTVFTVYADGLHLNHVVMATGAVDRLESATMPSLIGTNVAFEAIRLTVWRDREIREVVVAVNAGLILLRCARPRGEQETCKDDGDK